MRLCALAWALVALIAASAVVPTVGQAAVVDRKLLESCDTQWEWDYWGHLFPQDYRRKVTDCRAAVMRGENWLDVTDVSRRPYNDVIVRQSQLATTAILVERIRLRRDQTRSVTVNGVGPCMSLTLGAGKLGFYPPDLLPYELMEREDGITQRFLHQTTSSPVPFVLTPENKARAQAVYDRQWGRLSAEEQKNVRGLLAHTKDSYGSFEIDSLCRMTLATLDQLLDMPPEEAALTHKALLATERGWMVGLTKSSDPWALGRQDPVLNQDFVSPIDHEVRVEGVGGHEADPLSQLLQTLNDSPHRSAALGILGMVVGLVVVGVLVVVCWLVVRRLMVKRENEFTMPPLYGAVAMLCGAAAIGVFVIGGISPDEDDFSIWLTVSVLLAVLGGALGLGFVNWRLRVDDAGFQLRNAFRRTGDLVRWSEVRTVRTRRWNAVLDCAEAGVLRIPVTASGLGEILEQAVRAGAFVDAAVFKRMERF